MCATSKFEIAYYLSVRIKQTHAFLCIAYFIARQNLSFLKCESLFNVQNWIVSDIQDDLQKVYNESLIVLVLSDGGTAKVSCDLIIYIILYFLAQMKQARCILLEIRGSSVNILLSLFKFWNFPKPLNKKILQ